MKSKLFSAILIFLIFASSNAQKELWGVNTGAEYNIGYYGNITKYDINGENPAIVHEFDSIKGYRPKGKLFLASNGKLYGTTLNGGIAGPEGSGFTGGVLFEYDLILNKYRVVHYFQNTDAANNRTNPYIGVIEPVPGKLYGASQNRMFKYDIATGTMTFYNMLPLNLLTITTEFVKASDGNLYSTAGYGFCQGDTTPLWNGCIIKFNMTTNVLSVVHAQNCAASLEGNYPLGLVESSPGILNGITMNGGIYMPQFGEPSNTAGVLFEYNISTNQFTKKIDLDGFTIGGNPSAIINGGNGKLYGLCQAGAVPPNDTGTNPANYRGSLYEYTPSTNALVVKQYFGLNNLGGLANHVRYPTSLVKTSAGHFVGTIPNGALYRWNAETNSIAIPNLVGDQMNAINNSNLIEVCRKPSYQEITVNAFDACVGGNFTYNIQNSNATTYQWIKGGEVVAGQTTGILNLVNLSIADAGAYTCLMSNECGATTTMPLHLTVNCLGTNTFVEFEKAIKLHPNPTSMWLNIEIPDNSDIGINNCVVTNMLGQIVYQSGTTGKIDVSHLQNGIYIVSLQTDYGKWNGKFIKE